jgi:SAM-dependent methyltransferase
MSRATPTAMSLRQFWCDVRAYYRGCRNRNLCEFYDLESRLPYFDHVSRILCAHKRRLLLRWIGTAPVHGPILELGGGIGTFARQLGQNGYHVVAVDISVTKTRKAQRLNAKQRHAARGHVQHVAGDIRALGTGTALDDTIQQICHWGNLRPFDVILAADVLEHLPETPHTTVQHLRMLLAPHGRLFTSVPSRLCLHDPGHFWKLLPAQWETVFTASGFHIHRRQMSRLCWYGLPTPLPLAMVYELHPTGVAQSSPLPQHPT